MPDTFIPLMAPSSANREATFESLNLKPAGQPAAKLQTTAAASGQAVPETCAKPTITLQRTGEIVTGIRVQCRCGEVVELSCIY